MKSSEICNRDFVVEIIAPAIDQMVVTVGDIMVSGLATVRDNNGVSETIEYMRAKGVRRVPVVDRNSGLVGIIALDGLLELLAEELRAFAKLVRHEQKREQVSRR